MPFFTPPFLSYPFLFSVVTAKVSTAISAAAATGSGRAEPTFNNYGPHYGGGLVFSARKGGLTIVRLVPPPHVLTNRRSIVRICNSKTPIFRSATTTTTATNNSSTTAGGGIASSPPKQWGSMSASTAVPSFSDCGSPLLPTRTSVFFCCKQGKQEGVP